MYYIFAILDAYKKNEYSRKNKWRNLNYIEGIQIGTIDDRNVISINNYKDYPYFESFEKIRHLRIYILNDKGKEMKFIKRKFKRAIIRSFLQL